MSILRNKFKDRFVQVPNTLVSDVRISVHARFVYIYLRSKPDGWIVRNADVMNVIGVRNSGTMAKYWHELEMMGWITRHKTSAGTYDYELNEVEPIAEKPNVGQTAIANKPNVGQTATIYNTDYNSNTEKLSNNKNNTPCIPPSGETVTTVTELNLFENEQKSSIANSNIVSELKRRITALYKRRESTTWTAKETTTLRQIARRNGVLEEMADIEKLYNSDYPYRRRDVSTFLNNWSTELDRAQNYKPVSVSKYDRTTREVDYDPGF